MNTELLKKLPDPGPDRYWAVGHQPNKKTTPVLVELRERTNKWSTQFSPSFSKRIGFEDTVAAEEPIIEAAKKVLIRAGNVDSFVGIYPDLGASA